MLNPALHRRALTLLLTAFVISITAASAALAAPLRRPLSPTTPMLLVHVNQWSLQHPQEVFDAIPADLKPYVVLNLAMRSALDSGYETTDAWLNAAAQNGVYAMIQPSSGVDNSMSDTDLAPYEDLYQRYPNLIGYNFCEQAWGFDSASFAARCDLYVKLLELADTYGGYLYINDNFSVSNAPWNTLSKFRKSPAFRDATVTHQEHFIIGNKYTHSYGYHDNESGVLGAYLSGHAGHYAVRFDQFAWDWSGKAQVFGTEYPGRAGFSGLGLFACPEAVAGIPIVEQMLLHGASVLDGPEVPEITNTYRGVATPLFLNVVAEIFRQVVAGSIRIPSQAEVASRHKIAFVPLTSTNTPTDLYDGLYALDGGLALNRTWLKGSGRYPAIPTLFTDAPYETAGFETYVTSSDYTTRWPTEAAKVAEFNQLFPEESTGDLFVARVANKVLAYNPHINSDINTSATVPLKYNTCAEVELAFTAHTFGVVTESSDRLDLHLNNYRTDKSALWAANPSGFGVYSAAFNTYLQNSYIPNPEDSAKRATVIKVRGSLAEPTFSMVDRGNHKPSTAVSSWAEGVFTLTISHNGPVDVTLHCAGSATGKPAAPAPVVTAPPAPPPAYQINPYRTLRATGYSTMSGVTSELCSEGGLNITSISNGDWIRLRQVDFGSGANSLVARVAGTVGGAIQLRVDAVDGPIIGTCTVPNSGGAQLWTTVSCPIDPAAAQGVRDLYLRFTGGSGTSLFNLNWFQFGAPGAVPTAPTDLNALVASGNQIALTWSGTVDATAYNVKRSLNPGGPYTPIATGLTTPSFMDAAVHLGLTYYYIVTKTNAAGESQPSHETSVKVARLLPPQADAYVRDGGSAGSNFGTAVELQVKRDTSVGLSRESFLRFDVSGLNGVATAQLRLTPTLVGTDSATQINVEAITDDAWAENTINWNTRPTSAGTLLGFQNGGFVVKRPMRIDVLNALGAEASGDGNLSLRVTSAVAGGNKLVFFASRENTAVSDRPVIEYLFAAPPAPTGLATSVSSGQLRLTWNASPGATRYLVKRASRASGPFTIIAHDLTATEYTEPAPAEDAVTYYVVQALNAENVSGDSEPAIVGTPRPHAYLKFDDASGDTAADSSGHDRHGALVNGPTWVSGGNAKLGGALRLDGINDHVTLPTGVVDSLTEFTISCWVKLDSVSTWSRLFDFGYGSNNPSMYLTPRASNSTGPVRFGLRINNVAQNIEGTSALPANVWTHVAVTLSGNTGTLFVNGVAVGTNSAMTFRPHQLGHTTVNYLGRSQSSADPYLAGTIDQFLIYDRALNSSEVAALANPPGVPTINSPATATATYGAPFTYTVAASPSASLFGAHGLPAGLVIDPASGEISGTPQAIGDFNVILSATNSVGTGNTSLALSVARAPATITLSNLAHVYDGSAKTPSATTTPAGLSVIYRYNGSEAPPINAGTYDVTATIGDPNCVGSAEGVMVIAKAPASVFLQSLSQVYDGAPKPVTATTAPTGLAVAFTYDGNSAPPTNAGTYTVLATINDLNYTGSASGSLIIAKAPAAISLAPLLQRYDGDPKLVEATTIPGNLTVALTYDGPSSPPVYPGVYAVTATIQDDNYSGSLNENLVIYTTVLVRHPPTINGLIDGSVQLLTGSDLTLNRNSTISGDLLLPGTPKVRLNGSAQIVGQKSATGAEAPASYAVSINSGAVLRYLVNRVDAVQPPAVDAPQTPTGSRQVVLNTPTDSPGDFATLRDLTLNSGVGDVRIPGGAYGHFTVNGGASLVLGDETANEPWLYDFQALTLNGNTPIRVVGPVIITTRGDLAARGTIGNESHPEWLLLEVFAGSVTLNSGAVIYGSISIPEGTATINAGAAIQGTLSADRLIMNNGGLIDDLP